MSEQEQQKSPDRPSLDYRDPRDDAPQQQFGVLRALGAAFLVVLGVTCAIYAGGLNWQMRGAMLCGILAILGFATYGARAQKRYGATASVAGTWIGIATSLLLLGVCASIN